MFQPQRLQPLVDEALHETAALHTLWKQELADVAACQCLGSRQVELYLEHRRIDELRVRLAAKLAAEPFDLMAVYVRLIDTAGHQFLGFEHEAALQGCQQPGCNTGRLRSLAAQSYEILDEAVGRLLQAMPEDAVWIVVSDHGQLTGQDTAGMHQNNGVVLLAGPGIAPGLIFEAQVTDVAPTVLYLLGLPIASDMSGRLLTQALDPGLLQRFPPRYRASYEQLQTPLPRQSQALDEKLAEEQLEALEALGYME
jgi:predicted AlkP superfamily pyrophosphatase or phosphodiesterase